MTNAEISKDHATGCLLGALIGDAAGATLEFIGRQPTNDEVSRALEMVGGGVFGLAPGQITDDGELTLALAQALKAGQPYDADHVASYYRRWMLSRPFDVGNATRAAMSHGQPDTQGIAEIFKHNAATFNSESKANGSLMRATPIGIWGATMSIQQTIAAARLDAALTHPNPACQWAGVAYAVSIRHLLLNPKDNVGAFNVAQRILKESEAHEVSEWLNDARIGNLPSFHPLAGFVRIGFIYAYHHLQKGSDYVDALRATLVGGGDTDTNACIVGGLIGAYQGANSIPPSMQTSLLLCDTGIGRQRPDWLASRLVHEQIRRLIKR